MLERHELVEKQFSFGNRKTEAHNGLPDALGTQSCTVLDLHLGGIVMMVTKMLLYSPLSSKSIENPITTSVCNVYYWSEAINCLNIFNSKYLRRYVPTTTDGKADRSVVLKGFQMFQENLTLFQINIWYFKIKTKQKRSIVYQDKVFTPEGFTFFIF